MEMVPTILTFIIIPKKKGKIFDDLMSYAMRRFDYNTGTQLNISNFNSLYFDLSYQEESVPKTQNSWFFGMI